MAGARSASLCSGERAVPELMSLSVSLLELAARSAGSRRETRFARIRTGDLFFLLDCQGSAAERMRLQVLKEAVVSLSRSDSIDAPGETAEPGSFWRILYVEATNPPFGRGSRFLGPDLVTCFGLCGRLDVE